MALEIIWSKAAENDLYSMAEYAEANWSENALTAFIDNFFASIEILSTFPEIGLSEDIEKHIRSYLIFKT